MFESYFGTHAVKFAPSCFLHLITSVVRACVRACVCVCVCERERERERGGGRRKRGVGAQRDRETNKASVCV